MYEQLSILTEKITKPPDIPITEMTPEQTLNYIKYHHQAECAAQGKIMQGLAHFAELRTPNRPGIQIADGAAEEIAIELAITPNTATKKLCHAKTMTTRLPNTVEALAAGDIDYMRAKALHDETINLDDDHALQVEKRVLDGGKQENLRRFTRCVKREVLRADPHAEQRRTDAQAERNVIGTDRPDGMACLDIILQPHEAQAAYNQINQLAHKAKTPGRSLGQCRADVFMDLVMGKATKRPAVTVNVLVPMTTLMGLNQEPGEISGYGPITADYARELAQNATWRRVITDPTGHILEASRKRIPSPALRRHIQLRDKTCTQPGCHTPAQHCQLDHTTPYAHGGTTSEDNLAILCQRHNLMRQRTNWHIEQPLPGTLIFRTPAKRTVITKPEPYELPPF